MTPAELVLFECKYCGKSFNDGRRLGGHVRQSHPRGKPTTSATLPGVEDGEIAARVLELWKGGSHPLAIVSTLRVHPRFVKEVLKEYDDLLDEWKKFKEA